MSELEPFYDEGQEACVGGGMSMMVEPAPIAVEDYWGGPSISSPAVAAAAAAQVCTVGDATGLGLEQPGGYSVGEVFDGLEPTTTLAAPPRFAPRGPAISADDGSGMSEAEFRRTASMPAFCRTFPEECSAHLDRMRGNPVAAAQQAALSLKDEVTGTQTPAQQVIRAAAGSGAAWEAGTALVRNPRYPNAPRTKPTDLLAPTE